LNCPEIGEHIKAAIDTLQFLDCKDTTPPVDECQACRENADSLTFVTAYKIRCPKMCTSSKEDDGEQSKSGKENGRGTQAPPHPFPTMPQQQTTMPITMPLMPLSKT
jgi:hypothetical protein